MKTKRKQPLIRFKGFNEDWEEKKLGEIADVTMGQSPSSKNYTLDPNDRILVQGNADLRNGYVFPRIWTKEITKEAHIGDTLLSVRAPVGDVARTQYDVVIGRGVAAIKKDDFIYHFLDKTNKSNYWKVVSTGSTFESVSSSDIKNLSVKFPYLEEKNKISNMLNNLDKLIFLQEQKIELLNQVKKGLLQKLFSKKGSKVPEVRFRGFEGEWRKKKVSQLGDVYTGNTPSTKKEEYWSEKVGFPWVSPTDINELTISEGQKFLTEIGKSKARVVPKNSVLITCIASIGKNSINPVEISFNQQINAIVPKNFDAKFILNYFEFDKFKFKQTAGTSATSIINKTTFEEYTILTPSIEEQKLIGQVMDRHYKLINKEKIKLQQLQAMKQSLLQQMFI